MHAIVSFWDQITSCCRPSTAEPIDNRNQFDVISDLKRIENCSFNPSFTVAWNKKNQKTFPLCYPSLMILPIALRLNGFKQLFVENCLNDFFSLCHMNAAEVRQKFINATEFWPQDTIKLYACVNYIVSSYIKDAMIQKEANARKFAKHMKTLSRLLIKEHFGNSSKFLYNTDGSQKNPPALGVHLEEIGNAIMAIFGSCDGPSNEMIYILLRSYINMNLNNIYGITGTTRLFNDDINNTECAYAQKNFRKRQSNSPPSCWTCNRSIRYLGIRILNQCMKINDNELVQTHYY